MIPYDLKSFLVYEFTSPGYNSNYIRETFRHFETEI